MPRKPTGRPRGRPSRPLYPVPDRILLEVARLSDGDRLKEPEAARAVAKFVDGPIVLEDSKVRRILRQYRARRDWFLMRAKAPTIERDRPRHKHRNGPAFVTAYHNELLSFIESQRNFERMAKSLLRNPLAEEARRLEEQQRLLSKMFGPFG